MKKRIQIVIIIFTMFTISSHAQKHRAEEKNQVEISHVDANESYMIIGLGLDFIAPRAKYEPGGNNLAIGIGANIMGAVVPDNLYVGVDFKYSTFGSDDWNDALIYQYYGSGLDVSTWYNFLSANLIIRMQPPSSSFQPYIEFIAGFNYLFTDTSLDFDDDEIEDDSNVELDDFASNIGLGGGVMIPLISPEDLAGGLYLDVNARYLFGGKAEYLKSGSLDYYDGEVKFDKYNSRTDNFSFRIGIGVRF